MATVLWDCRRYLKFTAVFRWNALDVCCRQTWSSPHHRNDSWNTFCHLRGYAHAGSSGVEATIELVSKKFVAAIIPMGPLMIEPSLTREQKRLLKLRNSWSNPLLASIQERRCCIRKFVPVWQKPSWISITPLRQKSQRRGGVLLESPGNHWRSFWMNSWSSKAEWPST